MTATKLDAAIDWIWGGTILGYHWSTSQIRVRSFSCIRWFLQFPFVVLRCWSMRLVPCTTPKRRSRAFRISDHAATITILQIWQDQLVCQHLLNWLSHINYIGLWLMIQLIVVMNCDGISPINSTVDKNPMQSTPEHWCRRKKGGCETWQMAIFSRQGLGMASFNVIYNGIKFESPWCSWGLQHYQMILQTSFLSRCRCSSDLLYKFRWLTLATSHKSDAFAWFCT